VRTREHLQVITLASRGTCRTYGARNFTCRVPSPSGWAIIFRASGAPDFSLERRRCDIVAMDFCMHVLARESAPEARHNLA
jgi:hypothetical protein